MAQINGIEIVSSPMLPVLVPVIKLSNKVSVTDKFRVDFDRFLLDFFGEKPFIVSVGRKLYANPIVIESIRLEINKKSKALLNE